MLVALPKIHLSGPSHTLREGDSVNLTCNVTAGLPKPQLRWSKNGEELKEESTVLLLREVSEKDVGRYTCEATNAGGFSVDDVHVNVQSKFIFLDLRYSIFINGKQNKTNGRKQTQYFSKTFINDSINSNLFCLFDLSSTKTG